MRPLVFKVPEKFYFDNLPKEHHLSAAEHRAVTEGYRRAREETSQMTTKSQLLSWTLWMGFSVSSISFTDAAFGVVGRSG